MSKPDDTTTETGEESDDREATDGTTGSEAEEGSTPADGETLASGHGASPGIASGTVRIVADTAETDGVDEGDVIVTGMTTPEMVPAMKRAAGIVTDEGGITSHAAIVSRELGVPAVVGTGDATDVLADGRAITLDGQRGTVRAGASGSNAGTGSEDAQTGAGVDGGENGSGSTLAPLTATQVKVNVSIPDAAERAAATGADGVALLRLEHILLATNKTPKRYVEDHGEEAFVEEIAAEIETVAEAFHPRPVRARTLDAPTDELAELIGGEEEPHEHNPMLGYRGIRRSLKEPELCKLELRAFKRLHDTGYDNVEVMFPLPNDPTDVLGARDLMADVGIDPEKRRWGAMIETPASIRNVKEIAECGIDFAALGTNDIVQFMLAVDRNNGAIADRFDEMHPTVLEAMGEVIETCRTHGVDTTITGQAGSKPEMARFLVEKGITSISANIDAVPEVRQVVGRAERRLTLEAARS